MANRLTHEFNNIINEASVVSDFYSKRYFSRWNLADSRLCSDEIVSIPSIDMYYSVEGFELYEDIKANGERLSALSGSVLNSMGSVCTPVSFSVLSSSDRIGVFYGTNHQYAGSIKDSIKGNLSAAEVKNKWIPKAELENIQKYNGVILGTSTLLPSDIDKVINKLENKHFFLSFVFLPVSFSDIENEIYRIDAYMDSFQRVSKSELAIGSNRARHFDSENHDIIDVLELLTKEKKKLLSGQVNGLWNVLIHISSSDYDTYKNAGATLTAIFRARSSSESENMASEIADIDFPVMRNSNWNIPVAFLGYKDLGGMYGSSLLNIVDSNQASSFLLPPMLSHSGYSVRHLGESCVSTGSFDKYAPSVSGNSVAALGRLDDGSVYSIAIDSLRQHAFVTGASRYGKSTSVQRLIIEAHKRDVPFIVIEAVKKEYWTMTRCADTKKIRVYSAGMDANDLKLNPFQPEENTVLNYHIQNLIQAFLSMFEQTDPLPQILSELIYLCYEKKGWNTSCRVKKCTDLEYPVLSDMLKYLDECVEGIGYGNEVQSNMKGIIRVRVNSLIKQASLVLDTRENLSIDELFKTSAVIELDDFPDRTKSFVASLIAIKVNEFSRQCSMNGRLDRLLIIEEAHHIIPSFEKRTVSSNAAECSMYFSNMLAEVSAYGTGIIIVDQRASAVSSAALANTGIKIVHNIREGEDIEAISKSLSLKEYEESLLNKLKVGQAVIALPQNSEVCRVSVEGNFVNDDSIHLGCVFCDAKKCRKCSAPISQFEESYINTNGFSSSNIASCISALEQKSKDCLSTNDKLCLAGQLAECSEENPLLKRQALYDFRTILLSREENKIGKVF